MRAALSARLGLQMRGWLPEPDAGVVAAATLDEMCTMARYHLGEDVADWAGRIAARRVTERLRSRAATVGDGTAVISVVNDDWA